jgi:hypothetical protein
MKINLPRIYSRGPPPTMIINSKVRRLINVESYEKDFLAKSILDELYINRKLSQQKIADLFDVQHDTVRRWLDRLNIAVRNQGDSVSLAIEKYNKNPFSRKLSEKAYLIGLRSGDLSAQKHGRNVRIDVSSTHPAMLKLFGDVFSIYGKIGLYPKFSIIFSITRFQNYQWKIYCDVNESFEFILNKCDRIPRWIIQNDKLFYSFLSGYFDAEGCLSINYSKDRGGSLVWIICSTDKRILNDIHNFLIRKGFNINIKIVKEADGIEYNKNYWSIKICTKVQVLKLLKNMKLKHAEKIMKHKLALELINSNWKDASEKIVELRNKIKNEVKECVESAKEEYIKKHKDL